MSIPDAKRAKSEAASAQKKADKAHFVARFPGLVEELLEDCRALYPDYDSACVDRFKHVLEYNTMGGMWIPPPSPERNPSAALHFRGCRRCMICLSTHMRAIRLQSPMCHVWKRENLA